MALASALPRNWSAYLGLDFLPGTERTLMVPRRRHGPLSVQRPFYPEGDCCHVYLLHPPGGVVGGDRLDIELHAHPDTRGLVTTPGAGKFYLSAGDTARVDQSFLIAPNASLEYLPQENIYFPGAQVVATTNIELAQDSRLMLWEKHCFGRPANQEQFDRGQVTSGLQLRRDGRLLFIDKQRVDPAEIARASGLRGNPVFATLLLYSPSMPAELVDGLRDQVKPGCLCAVSQPEPELIVVRYLGQSTAEANDCLVRLWQYARPAVNGLDACAPRIWNT
jgi:urease accessory protein